MLFTLSMCGAMLARKYPDCAIICPNRRRAALRRMKPSKVCRTSRASAPQGTAAEAEGWFIGCPLTPRQLLRFRMSSRLRATITCGKIAEDLGAKILGLGALTSVVGDGGITVAKNLNIAVTTGNSYTTLRPPWTAQSGARKSMGTPLEEATFAVVGAAGSIGRTCALLLAREAKDRDADRAEPRKTRPARRRIKGRGRPRRGHRHRRCRDRPARCRCDCHRTPAVDAVILPEHLKSGAVVCDVARPRDVSVRVAKERNDVLVIEGGLVAVPGKDVDFHFDFGFPDGTAYACMSETMMLALEGRYESLRWAKRYPSTGRGNVEYGEQTRLQTRGLPLIRQGDHRGAYRESPPSRR